MLNIEITKPTLLLVDDEPVNLRVLKQMIISLFLREMAKKR